MHTKENNSFTSNSGLGGKLLFKKQFLPDSCLFQESG
jgi:hypothetical protein